RPRARAPGGDGDRAEPDLRGWRRALRAAGDRGPAGAGMSDGPPPRSEAQLHPHPQQPGRSVGEERLEVVPRRGEVERVELVEPLDDAVPVAVRPGAVAR